jgi:hypothetical protein
MLNLYKKEDEVLLTYDGSSVTEDKVVHGWYRVRKGPAYEVEAVFSGKPAYWAKNLLPRLVC